MIQSESPSRFSQRSSSSLLIRSISCWVNVLPPLDGLAWPPPFKRDRNSETVNICAPEARTAY